jgi:hypothetical protein
VTVDDKSEKSMSIKNDESIEGIPLREGEVKNDPEAPRRKWNANCSSQFVSFAAQLHALNEAKTREARGMSRFTGEDAMGNLVVRMSAPKNGRGYIPNTVDPQNPIFIAEMNAFEVKYDYETLRPITAYPVEEV